MLSVMLPFKKNNKSQDGQTLIEYLLLLILVLGISITLSRNLTKALDSKVAKMGGALEKQLKTGRVPVDVWFN